MKTRLFPVSIILIICVIGFWANIYGEPRSLYWERIDVEAHLDAHGTLHVTEKQVYVFNGAWNGGERIFNVRAREKLEFKSLKRVDEKSEEEIVLKEGDIDYVDKYKWSGDTLRWRSRLAEVPLFHNTKITYVLSYAYKRVLLKRDDQYLLNFNFLFPDRDGPVLEYTLDFTIDKVWKNSRGNSFFDTMKNVSPGQGYVIKIPLTYTGKGKLEVREPLSGIVIARSIQFSYLILLIFVVYIIVRDYRKGRFTRINYYTDLDGEYLKKHLFKYSPEEVGAIWDDTISRPEVTAILARLVNEGRLHSKLIPHPGRFSFLRKKILQLTLDSNAGPMNEYERKLVNGLFFNKRKITNTYLIKEHYKKKNKSFDPKAKIMDGLNRRIYKKKIRDEDFRAKQFVPPLVLIAVYFLIIIFGGIFEGIRYTGILLGVMTIQLIVCLLPLVLTALFVTSSMLAKPVRTILLTALPASVPFILLIPFIEGEGGELYLFQLIAMLSIAMSYAYFYILLSGTSNSAEKLAIRRELIAIREYFRRELSKERPRLKDEWFPYLVAYGLARYVDRWGRRFGPATGLAGGRTMSSSGGPVKGSGSSVWTGGGGRFGGAGATGAWVAATGAMSSAASSSSSSSGGGSSGGGGGGGW